MPAPATEQIDVQALLERLREEVRWGGNGADLSLRARARSAAEQFWAVTAERPPHGSPPVRFVKKALGAHASTSPAGNHPRSTGRG